MLCSLLHPRWGWQDVCVDTMCWLNKSPSSLSPHFSLICHYMCSPVGLTQQAVRVAIWCEPVSLLCIKPPLSLPALPSCHTRPHPAAHAAPRGDIKPLEWMLKKAWRCKQPAWSSISEQRQYFLLLFSFRGSLSIFLSSFLSLYFIVGLGGITVYCSEQEMCQL